MRGRPKHIRLDEISIDGQTQVRVQLDEATVADYAEAMQRGERFPAILVYADGSDRWLADGFHRYHAAVRAGLDALPTQVVNGTRTDAVWAAVGANKSNGLRMTTADKQRAVDLALRARPGTSDRQISEHVGVGHGMVAARRAELEAVGDIGATPGRTDSLGRVQPTRKPKATRERRKDTTKNVATRQQASSTEQPLPMLAAGLAHVEAAAAKQAPDEDAAAAPAAIPMETGHGLVPSEEPRGAPFAEAAPASCPTVDRLGQKLPNDAIADDFMRETLLTGLASTLRDVTDTVLAGISSHDPLFADIAEETFAAYSARLIAWIEAARPHAVCPYCKGSGCPACHQRGWVNESAHKSWAAAQRGPKHAPERT